MAFTVEDGTGVTGANSYVTVAYADAFFADRGNAAWAALANDAAKQPLLVQATDYTEVLYARRYIGEMTPTYPLSWPRTDTGDWLDTAYADDEIPDVLKRAICLYAVEAISGPLMPTPAIDDTGLPVVTTMKKVGPIEKEFKVVPGNTKPMAVRPYPLADGMIASLLRPAGPRVIR